MEPNRSTRDDKINSIKFSISAVIFLAVFFFPPEGIDWLDRMVLVFYAFFIFPFIVLHELGHLSVFWMYNDEETWMIYLDRFPPIGFIYGSTSNENPEPLIALGGPFVSLLLGIIFAVCLIRLKIAPNSISNIKKWTSEKRSLAEIYSLYAATFNIGRAINDGIPFAYNAQRKEFKNDMYLFLEFSELNPPDLSFNGCIPLILGSFNIFAIFFASFFLVAAFSAVLDGAKQLYNKKKRLKTVPNNNA